MQTRTVVTKTFGDVQLKVVDPELLRAIGWDGWFKVDAWVRQAPSLTERLQRLDRAYEAVKAGILSIRNIDTGLLKLTPLGEQLQSSLILEQVQ